MGYSELAYKIQSAKAKHKYEIEKLNAEQNKEMQALVEQCTHKYEDGKSAVEYSSRDRLDFSKKCVICDKYNP